MQGIMDRQAYVVECLKNNQAGSVEKTGRCDSNYVVKKKILGNIGIRY